ncbi:hypothetical protein D477_015431 [Arthrobacter crystallopoietes BAB-32]|uniref:Uncharacterized protein n=1 Tax=Arthrobacter crystallopoietes BAB-32 TaxID=1246476 RepID=N1UZY2_9MICC|nr:hypothetical protein [Arthrobacter crystallopoietes]EMY33324.1 hypothetical protein D477_015431 [Arthrobacter crystallopoietes BAB-32]
MEFAQDDAGDLIIGDVSKPGGRALSIGITGITGNEVLSLSWVETGETLNLTLDEAVRLRNEIDHIIRDRHPAGQS